MENEIGVNRVQPNDIIAEQAVLGSMLVDKDAVISAVELLKADDFYREDNNSGNFDKDTSRNNINSSCKRAFEH